MQFAGLNMLPLFSREGRSSARNNFSTSFKSWSKIVGITTLLGFLFVVTSKQGQQMFAEIEGAIAEKTVFSLTLDDAQFIGYERTTETSLYEALDLLKGTPILGINLVDVKSHIERLPWVEKASVSRQLSGGLYINIVERTPFALWQLDGEVWLIDADGVKITKDNLEDFSTIPFIVGEGAPKHYPELAMAFENTPQLAQKISSLIRVGDRRWDIMFDTGARLRLPEATTNYTLTQAWLRFANLEREHQLLSREVAVYDMRLADRMIVTLSEKGAKAPLAKGEFT